MVTRQLSGAGQGKFVGKDRRSIARTDKVKRLWTPYPHDSIGMGNRTVR